MRINVEKTKVMRIEKKKRDRPLDIQVDGKRLEQVDKYKYLGAIITDD